MKKKINKGAQQGDKFKTAAKEHGCDKSEREFADKLKKIVRHDDPSKADK